MSDCESLEIVAAPQTPPRPSTPISHLNDQTEYSNDVKSELLSESESEETSEQKVKSESEETKLEVELAEESESDIPNDPQPPETQPSEVKIESTS